ncbi:MAG: NUDIX hydrolase [Spirochaetaceae bacterium]|nr:NUDIX hydrolase [Spirochaetaceae bacterium]
MKNDIFKIGNIEDIEHLKWIEEETEEVFNTPIFNIVKSLRVSKKGVRAPFVTLLSPNWVTIIPWYRNEQNIPCFVMVQQYRHGSKSIIREFPAGMVDKGEEALTAAKRELIEETGIESKNIKHLSTLNPNPAFMNNEANFFLATNISKTSVQHLDTTELLDVLSVPVSEVIEKLGNSPLYDNGIMMIALGLFLKEAVINPDLIK